MTDLNNHLFAQLERLNEEDLTKEQLDQEIDRARAITGIAAKIVDANRVTVEAMRILEKAGVDITKIGNPTLLNGYTNGSHE